MTNNIQIKINNAPYTFSSSDVSVTESIGAALGTAVKETGRPAFVALKGDLGAGKTAFTRGFASVLSPGSIVRSPTYAIVNEYKKGSLPLYHFDLYRIEDEDDLYSIGFYDYVDNGICIVEWSERAEGELPSPRWEVTIVGCADTERAVTVKYFS